MYYYFDTPLPLRKIDYITYLILSHSPNLYYLCYDLRGEGLTGAPRSGRLALWLACHHRYAATYFILFL